jgi:hypothetical protein
MDSRVRGNDVSEPGSEIKRPKRPPCAPEAAPSVAAHPAFFALCLPDFAVRRSPLPASFRED